MQKILAILLMTTLIVACSSSDNVENNNVQDTEQSAQNTSDDNTQQNDENENQDSADNSDATNDVNSDANTSANDTSANTSADNDAANNTDWQSNVENTTNDAADALNNATNDASDAMNNAVDSTNDAMNNATADNTAANAGADGSVLLILNFNDLVEEPEKAIITKATKNKWFKGKQVVELTEKAYYDQSAQYMGATVFIGKVQRAYGEFTMDIRTGVVAKDDQGYYEEPINNWSVRGAQTAEDLAKEIQYGDDVFAKK